MAYEYSDNEARLQRKLIPLNIVVCVLCLVAAISLLFAPLLTVNLSDMKEPILALMESETGSDDGYGDSNPDEGSEDSGDIDIDYAVIIDALFDEELSFNAIDLINFANSDDSVFLPWIASKMGKIMDAIMIPTLSQSILKELEVEADGIDFEKLNAKFEALNNVKSEDDMRVAAGDLIDELARLGNIPEEEINREGGIDAFVGLYNDTVEVTGGDFDLEKMFCVVASTGLELETPVTDYESLFGVMLGGNGEDPDMADAMESISMLDEALKAMAQGVFGMVMFSAIMWMVLFLFSLLHIFAKNKRFVMWYVKMFGGIPWLLFGFLPMTMGGALASIGEEAAIAASLFGAITSSTWISGVCLGLLWLVSIFWAFPIKHKIRKDRKG